MRNYPVVHRCRNQGEEETAVREKTWIPAMSHQKALMSSSCHTIQRLSKKGDGQISYIIALGLPVGSAAQKNNRKQGENEVGRKKRAKIMTWSHGCKQPKND